jgi:hypothetical protein
MVKDKYLADLLAVTQPYERLESIVGTSIGDRISGLLVRGFLNATASNLLRKLDKAGISPGLPAEKKSL